MIDTAPDTQQAEPAPASIEAERGACLLVAGRPALAELLHQQLPNDWQITLVRTDADESRSGDGFEAHRGDPTSALVLQRAGAADARAILAALPDPAENLEVCRLARQQLGVPNVIAVVGSAGDAEPFAALGVETIDELAVVATAVRNQIERASAAVQSVGQSQGELVEITLQPSAPVVGRRLRAFRQIGWSLAAVYRDKQLILPEPEVVLQAGDRLLLVGQPDRLSVIAEYLRVGRPQFPLPYGTSIAGPVWGEPSPALLQEVAYLAQGVGLKEICLTVCGGERGWQAAADRLDLPVNVRWGVSDASAADAVSEVLGRIGPGCLVVPPGRARLPRPFAGLAPPLKRALQEAHVPVLVPRGCFPYERILLPVFRTPLPQGAVQSSFDLAEQLSAELVTVHVQAPAFLEEHGDDAAVVVSAVDEMAAVRRRQVQHERRTGNPLGELQQLSQPNQLIVLSHRRGRRWRSFRPDVSAYLAQRFSCTALILPVDN